MAEHLSGVTAAPSQLQQTDKEPEGKRNVEKKDDFEVIEMTEGEEDDLVLVDKIEAIEDDYVEV